MASLEFEEQRYQDDVKAVKQWWSTPRWRYTKRPFTAEQIVAKRGNLKIDYPSNVQSKKLWDIVEHRFKVIEIAFGFDPQLKSGFRTEMLAPPMDALNQPCSLRWQSTSTLCMYLVGSALRLRRQRMNLRLT